MACDLWFGPPQSKILATPKPQTPLLLHLSSGALLEIYDGRVLVVEPTAAEDTEDEGVAHTARKVCIFFFCTNNLILGLF